MTGRTDIIVVGDSGLDLIAKHAGAVPHGGDIRAAIHTVLGGSGANTATWLAKYDTTVHLVTRVGADIAAEQVRSLLTAAGVHCAFTADGHAPTFTAIVLVDDDGQRTMLADRGANARLQSGDLSDELLSQGKHLHLSGYLLLAESSRPAALEMLARAQAAGLTTSVDPQAATLIEDPAEFLSWIRGVDVLLPNEPELRALTGSANPESARELLSTVKMVALTQGEKGATVHTADGTWQALARPVGCVDSTGAGDAFNAAFLSHWLTDSPLPEALAAGVEAGTQAVTKLGATH